MKKSIIALSALLFLFVIFAAPTQADIMSWEDRAILRTQLESTPIGDEDGWQDLQGSEYPEEDSDEQLTVVSVISSINPLLGVIVNGIFHTEEPIQNEVNTK